MSKKESYNILPTKHLLIDGLGYSHSKIWALYKTWNVETIPFKNERIGFKVRVDYQYIKERTEIDK